MGSEKKILIYLSHCLHKLLQFQTSAAVRPVPVSPHLPLEALSRPGGLTGRGATGGEEGAGGLEAPSSRSPPPSPAGTKEPGPVPTGPRASWPGQAVPACSRGRATLPVAAGLESGLGPWDGGASRPAALPGRPPVG